MKKYLFILSALFIAATTNAHTANDSINRTVMVESTYNPIIAGAVKRNFIPEEVKPSMDKEVVVYANENVDLAYIDRQALPIEAMAVSYDRVMPGYAHLGYGNYNNLSAMAAYKLNLGERSDLALKTFVDGWNGKLRLPDNAKWRSKLYEMGFGADYDVQFSQVALNAGVDAARYSYNYLGETVNNQKSNLFGVHVGAKGTALERYFYQASLAYTYFGRNMYLGVEQPHRENRFKSNATLGMNLDEWGVASVALCSDVLAYHGMADYRAYHSLEITPRWDYEREALHFVSGFNMSILTGHNVAHPVQFSPECRVSYIPTDRYAVSFVLDGGRDMHSFGALYELSPYWMSKEQVKPTYTFVNAHLRGDMRIIEGIHAYLGTGYKVLSDAVLETIVDTLNTIYTGLTNHNAQVITTDAGISYNYKDYASFSVKGTYQHWMLKGDRTLLARAPQFTMDVEARMRIISNLEAYTQLQLVSFTNTKVAGRERAIINWSLGAHYALNKWCTLFLDAHNLLNRRYSYYAGYPAQGFNVLAGAMVSF